MIDPDWHLSATQSALLGVLLVAASLTLLILVLVGCLIVLERRPSLEPIRAALRRSGQEAALLAHQQLAAEHLLLAVAGDANDPAVDLLASKGVTLERL